MSEIWVVGRMVSIFDWSVSKIRGVGVIVLETVEEGVIVDVDSGGIDGEDEFRWHP